MSAARTIAGACLEVIGLGFVFYELVRIRSVEFDIAPPWERIAVRFARKPHETPADLGELRATATSSTSAEVTVPPRLAPRDASLHQRVSSIEDHMQ